jgi:hypothetical protein
MFFEIVIEMALRNNYLQNASAQDKKLLRKYKHGRTVDTKEELDKLDRLANLGLIQKGMNFDGLKITAKTSELGMTLLS